MLKKSTLNVSDPNRVGLDVSDTPEGSVIFAAGINGLSNTMFNQLQNMFRCIKLLILSGVALISISSGVLAQNLLRKDSVRIDSVSGTDFLPVGIGLMENQGETRSDSLSLNERVADYAKSFLGIPYRYAASNPKVGFDCSGLMYYVFKQFDMTIPRSSASLSHYGKEVKLKDSKIGDLVLFTRPSSKSRTIGHVGMIVENTGNSIKFIHSSSGKAYSVIISSLSGTYLKRFVKAVRVLQDTGEE